MSQCRLTHAAGEGDSAGREAVSPTREAVGSPFRIAVICTANQCRSVMVEHLWSAQLSATSAMRRRAEPISVRSAGLLPGGQPATPRTVRVLSERGLDASGHRSHQIGSWLSSSDLIIAMTFEQLRVVIASDPALWPRVFALRQLVARAEAGPPRSAEQTPADWIAQLHAGRSARDTIAPAWLDIEDPTGGSLRRHRALIDELDVMLARLTELLLGAHN